jgi:membrane protein DedA with SNARE-associated domain
VEHFITSWGYLAIFLLTVAEAACIPVPSEITLGLGGALASGYNPFRGTIEAHPLNLAFVILVGVCGEMVGSFVAYGVGRTGGRALVDRFGKYVLLSHKDLDRAEAWFDGKGESVVLFARFIPLVRSFISLVAGLAEMSITKFVVFTVIGCTLWCAALASIGYSLGSSWHHVLKAFSYAGYIVGALVVLAIAGAIYHRVRTMRGERAAHSPAAVRARADKTR